MQKENRHDPVFPIRCHCGFLWVKIAEDRQGLWTEKVLKYEVFPKLQTPCDPLSQFLVFSLMQLPVFLK